MAKADDDYRYARARMVQHLTRGRYPIRDPRVLEVMGEIPRHRFVPESTWRGGQAYEDHALPIGASQTISQPYVVARMSAWLKVQPEHKVLEIGTGSGYQTAILARLARLVFSMERIPSLAKEAIVRMRELGIDNVKIQTFDGTVGWSAHAPYDRILVTAGAQTRVPEPLLQQLAPRGGMLVAPEGDRRGQHLVRYRTTDQGLVREVGEAVAFVPLIGRHGWPADEVPS